MSLLDSILSIFGKKPNLPVAPKPDKSSTRIYLRGDRLAWKSMADVRAALGDRVRISGLTVDLLGAVIDGGKLDHPKDRQDEKALGVSVSLQGFTLRNGWVDDIPGGIKVKRSDCAFEKLKFIHIGEDALSTVGEPAEGIFIGGCEFWNDRDGDKSIQLNQAFEARLKDVRIVGGITGLRVQESSYGTKGVVCDLDNVTFEGCETGINGAGNSVTRLKNVIFKNVKKPWVLNPGSKVTKV